MTPVRPSVMWHDNAPIARQTDTALTFGLLALLAYLLWKSNSGPGIGAGLASQGQEGIQPGQPQTRRVVERLPASSDIRWRFVWTPDGALVRNQSVVESPDGRSIPVMVPDSAPIRDFYAAVTAALRKAHAAFPTAGLRIMDPFDLAGARARVAQAFAQDHASLSELHQIDAHETALRKVATDAGFEDRDVLLVADVR